MDGSQQLEVIRLNVGFQNKNNYTNILNNISFSVRSGETLCIVGESGCGKSLTSLSIMRLLPKNGVIKSGQIKFNGEDLTKKTKKQMSNIRGNDLSMIFQEPMTSLNPVQTIGKQISEIIRIHKKTGKKKSMQKVVEMLKLVGIPSPEQRIHNYPHQLSGGMRQRVMIAMAIACNPKLLIADEPTTALDVTIQAQILDLLKQLQQHDMSLILITHDLGVVSEIADKVLVMYAGMVVEYSDMKSLFNDPQHPYTQGLIESVPKLNEEQDELPVIKGSVPDAKHMPAGCRFSTRCPFAKSICFTEMPPLVNKDGQHQVSCWMHTKKWAGVNKEGIGDATVAPLGKS